MGCGVMPSCQACYRNEPTTTNNTACFAPRPGGRYVKKVTYEFVGEGRGEFDRDVQERTGSPNQDSKLAFLFGLLLWLFIVAALFLRIGGSASVQTTVKVVTTTTEPEAYVDI